MALQNLNIVNTHKSGTTCLLFNFCFNFLSVRKLNMSKFVAAIFVMFSVSLEGYKYNTNNASNCIFYDSYSKATLNLIPFVQNVKILEYHGSNSSDFVYSPCGNKAFGVGDEVMAIYQHDVDYEILAIWDNGGTKPVFYSLGSGEFWMFTYHAQSHLDPDTEVTFNLRWYCDKTIDFENTYISHSYYKRYTNSTYSDMHIMSKYACSD